MSRLYLATLLSLFLILSPGCHPNGPKPVVVYCSHDAVFAQGLLDQFTAETGIPCSIKYDTEATKSLGLVNLLIAEKEHPRCDVFWNNQVLGTVELQQAGVLEPYQGSGYARIPRQFKDPEGYWTGFAARLRIYIVNTDRMEASEERIQQSMNSGDLSRMAIAKPIYGTTLTHYALLWHVLGGDQLKDWHHQSIQRGLKVVGGNAQVKDLVAAGTCDFGWTDTDDFFAAQDAGFHVDLVPVRVNGQTISIPNSVCLIKGARNRANAERLIDFLLSEQTEIELSRSESRQIPLGQIDESKLSSEVQQLRTWAAESYDLSQLPEAHHACLEWLREEYLR